MTSIITFTQFRYSSPLSDGPIVRSWHEWSKSFDMESKGQTYTPIITYVKYLYNTCNLLCVFYEFYKGPFMIRKLCNWNLCVYFSFFSGNTIKS